MKNARSRTDLPLVPGLVLLGLLLAQAARAQAPVTVALNPGQAAATPISERFSGLSYEVSEMSGSFAQNGQTIYRLSPQNLALVGIFESLGIRNLRIGGNSSDDASYNPGRRGTSTSGTVVFSDDLDRLFGLASAAGTSVILTVPLKPPMANAQNDALEAAYAWSNYAGLLLCFAIGNEPDLYFSSYASYKSSFDMFKVAVAAAAPGAAFCGPCVAGNSSWCVSFANDREASLITHHNYPGGNALSVTDPAASRYALLAINNQGFYNGWVPSVLNDGLPYRVEETNSFYNGGANNVSNTYAAALWGLDYMHWFAARAADGLNFHTGDNSTGYSAIAASGGVYTVQPLGYGIKAFDLGGHGMSVPVTLTNPQGLNLTAYGVLSQDNRLFVTIVNKTTATNSLAANVTIRVTGRLSYGAGTVMDLSAPNNNDLGALSGLTLGGSPIAGDGTWLGMPTRLPPPSSGQFTLTVPGPGAVVVTLTPSPLPPPRQPKVKSKATVKPR